MSTSPTFLVLHGGGGPFTVAPIAAHLETAGRVLAPTLPGWDGTPRAPELDGVPAYAAHVRRDLEARDLRDVIVVGSSLGAWIACELALADTDHRIAGLVLVNGVGIDVPDAPIANLAGKTPPEIAQLSFHDPSKLGAGSPTPTPASLERARANQATMAAIAGSPLRMDPTLRDRLGALRVPVTVVWGTSDRVATLAYGRAFAAAIPGARFEPIAEAGHLPQLEQPAATFRAIDAFVARR